MYRDICCNAPESPPCTVRRRHAGSLLRFWENVVEATVISEAVMNQGSFYIYGTPSSYGHDIIESWVVLNQHLGGKLWPPKYQPLPVDVETEVQTPKTASSEGEHKSLFEGPKGVEKRAEEPLGQDDEHLPNNAEDMELARDMDEDLVSLFEAYGNMTAGS